MMSNKSLGGGTSGIQPATVDVTDPCAYFSQGLSTIGLLVKTTGVVTYVDDTEAFAYIDDGSGLYDGSGHPGLRVSLENAPAPMLGSFAKVTGCCSATQIAGRCARRLRPRRASDIECTDSNGLWNGGFEDEVLSPWTLIDGLGGVVAPSVPLGSITPKSGDWFLAIMPRSVPFAGAICQVATVPPGRYHVSAWSRVFHGVLGADAAVSRVGIDPTGGNNPASSAVAWSWWDTQLQSGYSEWRELLTPTVDVAGGRCTVFCQYVQRAARYQVNCFDDAVVVRDQ
jgi:hypothetical protein